MPPILLTIQTASPAGSVALSDGEHLLAEFNLDSRKTPTEWLLAAIDDLLVKTGLTKDSLDAIGIVRGPGAFTGLRVGLATAKGLALALGMPLGGRIVVTMPGHAAAFHANAGLCHVGCTQTRGLQLPLPVGIRFPSRYLRRTGG